MSVYDAVTLAGPSGDAAPVVHEPEFTAPPPVRYATNTSPAWAGEVDELSDPFGFWMMAWVPLVVKIPGAAGGMFKVTVLLATPEFITTSVIGWPVGTPTGI